MKTVLSRVGLVCGCALAVVSAGAAPIPETPFYVKSDLGIALKQDVDVKDVVGGQTKISFDPGLRFSAGVGYNLSEWLALEVESGFVYNSVDQVTTEVPLGAGGAATVSQKFDASVYQMPTFANLVYRIPLRSRFKPYFGAGAGGVITIVDESDIGTADELTFGFQGFVGTDYVLNERWDVGVAYKVMGTMDHRFGFDEGALKTGPTYTHAFVARVKWKF